MKPVALSSRQLQGQMEGWLCHQILSHDAPIEHPVFLLQSHTLLPGWTLLLPGCHYNHFSKHGRNFARLQCGRSLKASFFACVGHRSFSFHLERFLLGNNAENPPLRSLSSLSQQHREEHPAWTAEVSERKAQKPPLCTKITQVFAQPWSLHHSSSTVHLLWMFSVLIPKFLALSPPKIPALLFLAWTKISQCWQAQSLLWLRQRLRDQPTTCPWWRSQSQVGKTFLERERKISSNVEYWWCQTRRNWESFPFLTVQC